MITYMTEASLLRGQGYYCLSFATSIIHFPALADIGIADMILAAGFADMILAAGLADMILAAGLADMILAAG